MVVFDKLLKDPDSVWIGKSMTDAAHAANSRCRRHGLLAWPPDDYAEARDDIVGKDEGVRRWGVRPSSYLDIGLSLNPVAAVLVAWWTDAARRKWCRFIGWSGRLLSTHWRNILWSGPTRPPLWLLRPDDLAYRIDGRRRLWAMCPDCGVGGEPERVCWMVERCGPCHDRREACEPPAAWRPARTLLQTPFGVSRLAFLPDGRRLLCDCGQWMVDVCDLTTGTLHEQTDAERQEGPTAPPDVGLSAVIPGLDSDGTLLVRRAPDGPVLGKYQWHDGGARALAVSPDGAWLATVGGVGDVKLWPVTALVEG
jgi:hypothetical protein